MALPVFAPMLASTAPPREAAEWAFEPKLDGWRALVYVDGSVTVRTRSGRDITDRVDSLQALSRTGRRMVLDGELVAEAGRAGDFYRLGPNLRASSRRDITFVAFDLLVLDDENLCARPYHDRRSLLEELDLSGPGWVTIPALVGAPRACCSTRVPSSMSRVSWPSASTVPTGPVCDRATG